MYKTQKKILKYKRKHTRIHNSFKKSGSIKTNKTIKGGSGRGASGASSMLIKNTTSEDFQKKLDANILYFKTVYENMQRYTHPKGANARAMIQSSKQLEKHNPHLRLYLINREWKQIYDMILARNQHTKVSVKGQNLSKTIYEDDAKLSALLLKNRASLDKVVEEFPYLYPGGVEKTPTKRSMFPSVPEEDPGENNYVFPSPPKHELMSPPTQYEPYFEKVKFFREVMNNITMLASTLKKQSILTEIDKSDIELYEDVNQKNLPTYQGQIDIVPRLDKAIERLLAIGRKYGKK